MFSISEESELLLSLSSTLTMIILDQSSRLEVQVFNCVKFLRSSSKSHFNSSLSESSWLRTVWISSSILDILSETALHSASISLSLSSSDWPLPRLIILRFLLLPALPYLASRVFNLSSWFSYPVSTIMRFTYAFQFCLLSRRQG